MAIRTAKAGIQWLKESNSQRQTFTIPVLRSGNEHSMLTSMQRNWLLFVVYASVKELNHCWGNQGYHIT